jgi:hypothetical protein
VPIRGIAALVIGISSLLEQHESDSSGKTLEWCLVRQIYANFLSC